MNNKVCYDNRLEWLGRLSEMDYNTPMQRRGTILPIFLLFLFIAGGIWFGSARGWLPGVTGFFEKLVIPVQQWSFGISHTTTEDEPSDDALRRENNALVTRLAKMQELEKENEALADQFKITNPSPKNLLPAKIIGSNENELIIDKGSADGLKSGQVVVSENSLIGQLSVTSVHRSVVRLISYRGTAFTAVTRKTDALGVIAGIGGNTLLLDKVVLSDTLTKGDVVVTKGDVDKNGYGFPPDLIVGKIVSVNKQASNLFQQAEVQSLVDVGRLTTVFVMPL